MQDRTITNALLALRGQIIRGNLDGLKHVNALLAARGVDLDGQRVPHKMPADTCERGEVKMLILEALRTGPKRPPEIAALILAGHPDIPPCVALRRAYRAAHKLRVRGFLVSDDGVWRLAQ